MSCEVMNRAHPTQAVPALVPGFGVPGMSLKLQVVALWGSQLLPGEHSWSQQGAAPELSHTRVWEEELQPFPEEPQLSWNHSFIAALRYFILHLLEAEGNSAQSAPFHLIPTKFSFGCVPMCFLLFRIIFWPFPLMEMTILP